jgi:hypothetical protein
MKIGFTGTREGMTEQQRSAFDEWICSQPDITEFHHGDCVGADDQAADVLHEIRTGEDPGPLIKVVCHPPDNNKRRAFNGHFDELRPVKKYTSRNRDIVNETDVLLVCPLGTERQTRGGTWYTADYAQRLGRRVVIFWPNGTVEDSAEAKANE